MGEPTARTQGRQFAVKQEFCFDSDRGMLSVAATWPWPHRCPLYLDEERLTDAFSCDSRVPLGGGGEV